MALGPEHAETCNRVPVDCNLDGSVFWGECHSALSDEWLYVQRLDQATCTWTCVPSRTGCRSSSSMTPWMPPARTGTWARAEETFFDCTCFCHAPGVIWQCFPEILDNPSVGVLVMKAKV